MGECCRSRRRKGEKLSWRGRGRSRSRREGLEGQSMEGQYN